MHKWTCLYSSKTLTTKAGGGVHLAILCQSLSWTKLHHKGLHISRELRQKLQSLLRLKLRSHTAFFLLHSIAQRRSPGQPRSKVNRLHLLKECSTTSYCKVMYIQGWEEFLCPFLPIVYPPTHVCLIPESSMLYHISLSLYIASYNWLRNEARRLGIS